MTTYKLSDIISPAFYDIHRTIKSGGVQEALLKGGRGSTKSSFASVETVLQIIKHPDMHAAVFRKVGNTLRNSVYEQVCWAVSALGLSKKFRFTVSPMEITYLPTKQKILFFGLDKPEKIKSIKVAFGYIGIAWFEELDQYAGPEEIRSVEQSVLRGGPLSLEFKSFNPPAMARNWANRYALEKRQGKLIHSSTYLTTPAEWLGPKFIEDAEYLKVTNEIAYRHEYLGEVVGTGTAVFDNIVEKQMPLEEVLNFDRLYYGVDWGWYPDPWAYNAVHYDAARRDLYIFDELTRRKTSNQQTAKLLIDRRINGLIIADSSENKSVGDYKAFGLMCRAAEKGPGSVEYSTKWLQSLNHIYIDPERCPDTYKEFSEYEYERDKNGEIMGEYPDLNNHHIDAVRYALELVWKQKGR